MEGAQSRVVLRARALQFHVLTDDADDVGLLLDRVREVAGVGHSASVHEPHPPAHSSMLQGRVVSVENPVERPISPDTHVENYCDPETLKGNPGCSKLTGRTASQLLTNTAPRM